jgi:endonuclease/exonuclease/phosphatase family metal-dependent hydrolase
MGLHMKLLTLNLRHDEDRWPERSQLILEELTSERPDVIAFQEVALHINQAHFIADKLNATLSKEPYYVFLECKGGLQPKEGIAFLTRMKVVEHARIELPEGDRVAQFIRVEEDGETYDIVNTHLHHLPKDDEYIRLKQIRILLGWMYMETNQKCRWLLAGDFNAKPNSSTVNEVKKRLKSAFHSVHGVEPDFTFPTPLVSGTGEWYQPRTLDYIFFDPSAFRIEEAYLTFTRPHPQDERLFPSDHFGLVAKLFRLE